MSLTNPQVIPASKRDSIKAVCIEHGPNLIGDRYPSDENGPKTDLTNAETAQVFEAITREFWRQQIEAHEVQAAATAAAEAKRTENAADPFAG